MNWILKKSRECMLLETGWLTFLKILGEKKIVYCGIEETMSHIYSCEYLNTEEIQLKYEKIFNGNISEQISIFRRFEHILKTRNEIRLEKETGTNDIPCDQFIDPLNCVQYSFG